MALIFLLYVLYGLYSESKPNLDLMQLKTTDGCCYRLRKNEEVTNADILIRHLYQTKLNMAIEPEEATSLSLVRIKCVDSFKEIQLSKTCAELEM